MRILFATFQTGIAGSALSTYYLAEGLQSRGHQVWVAAPPDSVLKRKAEEAGIGFIPLEKGNKYFDRGTIRKLREVIIEESIQLVNSQSSRDRYALGMIKWFYLKNLILVHTRRQRANSSGFFLQNIFYARTATKMVAVSEGVKESMVQLGFRKHQIEVIHNGTPKAKYQLIDHTRVQYFRDRYNLVPEDRVIGCVARKKRQEQLIEALKFVNEDIKVVFVGISESDVAEAITRHKPKQRLIFAGVQDSQDVLHHFPLFTLKVLPSVIEGFSQAILEAMAMRVPVIATNACGNPDLITHGVTGFLFSDGDVAGLGSLINKLLDGPTAVREGIVEEAQQQALSSFEIERVLTNYEQLFQELIKKASEEA